MKCLWHMCLSCISPQKTSIGNRHVCHKIWPFTIRCVPHMCLILNPHRRIEACVTKYFTVGLALPCVADKLRSNNVIFIFCYLNYFNLGSGTWTMCMPNKLRLFLWFMLSSLMIFVISSCSVAVVRGLLWYKSMSLCKSSPSPCAAATEHKI